MTAGLAVALAATAVAALLFSDAVRGVTVLVRRDRPSYARLRRELRERRGTAFTSDEIDQLAGRLARVDRIERDRPRWALLLRIAALALVLVAAGLGPALLDALPVADRAPFLVALVAAVLVAAASGVVGVVAAARVARRRREVAAAQRSEVVRLLEDARLPQRQRVPGLGDRVSRALAILREKQR